MFTCTRALKYALSLYPATFECIIFLSITTFTSYRQLLFWENKLACQRDTMSVPVCCVLYVKMGAGIWDGLATVLMKSCPRRNSHREGEISQLFDSRPGAITCHLSQFISWFRVQARQKHIIYFKCNKPLESQTTVKRLPKPQPAHTVFLPGKLEMNSPMGICYEVENDKEFMELMVEKTNWRSGK